ncbi:signal peptidase I [Mycoplasma sp. P36-A1]|uniref:signal peptidase I n=1 Tax=Mycoplasma sp. P36-A1 TaxID=3252900 RepID=UPI003C2E1362
MFNSKENKELIGDKKSFKKEIIETIVIVAVIFLIFQYLLMSVRVQGTSMEPTYVDGERGVMVRASFLNKADYHDVVVVDYFDEDKQQSELIVKRVFGMPNDTVQIKDNVVLVNGVAARDDTKSPDTVMEDMDAVTLSSDEYFILGDNRNVSLDSRIIGPIKKEQIKAINGISYWPVDKIGLIN